MPKSSLSAIDILKHTARSNCGECELSNCMAFAALVARGQMDPGACPYMEESEVERIRRRAGVRANSEAAWRQELIDQARKRMEALDFVEAAKRLGARVENERLVLRVLGKRFEIDRQGGLHSECHVNNWIHLPLLGHVLAGRGEPTTGEWTAFRDLKHARSWERFFNHRCEGTLNRLAEEDPDLFMDTLDLFGEDAADHVPGADYARLLRPLPSVPLLVALFRGDERFGAKVTVLFDRSVERNLPADAAYYLSQGIAEMINRIMERHGTGMSIQSRD